MEKLRLAIWNHAIIIALTFANRIGQTNREMRLAKRRNDKERVMELFCKKIQEWEVFLRDILAKISNPEIEDCSRICIVRNMHVFGNIP